LNDVQASPTQKAKLAKDKPALETMDWDEMVKSWNKRSATADKELVTSGGNQTVVR